VRENSGRRAARSLSPSLRPSDEDQIAGQHRPPGWGQRDSDWKDSYGNWLFVKRHWNRHSGSTSNRDDDGIETPPGTAADAGSRDRDGEMAFAGAGTADQHGVALLGEDQPSLIGVPAKSNPSRPAGAGRTVPVGHQNSLGLTTVGEYAIGKMMSLGMLIDTPPPLDPVRPRRANDPSSTEPDVSPMHPFTATIRFEQVPSPEGRRVRDCRDIALTAAGMPKLAPNPSPCALEAADAERCPSLCCFVGKLRIWRPIMGGLIYLIGLIVVILFILSFLGLR
jgi:hypothetical protein